MSPRRPFDRNTLPVVVSCGSLKERQIPRQAEDLAAARGAAGTVVSHLVTDGQPVPDSRPPHHEAEDGYT